MTNLKSNFEIETRVAERVIRLIGDYRDQRGFACPQMERLGNSPRRDSPYFESLDVTVGLLAAAMMLGPLIATVSGFGK